MSDVGTGNLNQVLLAQGAGASPSFSTATYLATTTLNQILYSSSANVIAGLATATNGVLITDATTGIPSISSTLPSAVQGNITTVGTISSGTWTGTPIGTAYGGTGHSQVATSTGTILRADGTNWTATTSTYPNTNAISTLLYASAANVMSALATANNGTLITSGTGVPSISSTLPSAVQGNITSTGTVTSGSWGATDYSAANFVNATNFTPSVGGSPTYSNQLGVYERLGNVVFIRLRVTFTSGPTGGNINIAGLPLAPANNANLAAFSIWRNGGALSAANTQIFAINKQGTSSIDLYQYNSTTGAASTVAQAATDDIIITGCYSLA